MAGDNAALHDGRRDTIDPLNTYLTDDHARCNGLLRRIEQSVAAARWPDARREVTALRDALERHLLIEERIGFIEAVLGNVLTHTATMRAEQLRIRHVAQRLDDAVAGQNAHGFVTQAEALLLAMPVHGAKAEPVLHPVSGHVSGSGASAILGAVNPCAIAA